MTPDLLQGRTAILVSTNKYLLRPAISWSHMCSRCGLKLYNLTIASVAGER
jgi:hypothetical protein